jgi:hypothetical protein
LNKDKDIEQSKEININQILKIEYWERFNIKSYKDVKDLLDFYKDIISKGDRNLEIFEKHHMVPKSIDIDKIPNKINIIKLTPKEHFIIHEILNKCFSGKYAIKMAFAFRMLLCNSKNHSRDYKMNAEDYEKLKNQNRINMTGINNPNYGKHWSDEIKMKMSKGSTGIYHTEETKQKMSNSKKGPKNSNYQKHWKVSEETKQKMSIVKLGEKNSFYNKHHTEEAKQKMKQNHADFSGSNHPQYGRTGNLCHNYGKIWINNGSSNKLIKKEFTEEYIANNWSLGMVKQNGYKGKGK